MLICFLMLPINHWRISTCGMLQNRRTNELATSSADRIVSRPVGQGNGLLTVGCISYVGKVCFRCHARSDFDARVCRNSPIVGTPH